MSDEGLISSLVVILGDISSAVSVDSPYFTPYSLSGLTERFLFHLFLSIPDQRLTVLFLSLISLTLSYYLS